MPTGDVYKVVVVATESHEVLAMAIVPATPAGDVYKVVVGVVGSDEVLAVAITPATPAGQADASMVGTAIMRTLELIEANATPNAG